MKGRDRKKQYSGQTKNKIQYVLKNFKMEDIFSKKGNVKFILSFTVSQISPIIV